MSSVVEYAAKAEAYIAEACRPGQTQQIIDNCLKTADIYATLAVAAGNADFTEKHVIEVKPWSSEREVDATEARDKLLAKIEKV